MKYRSRNLIVVALLPLLFSIMSGSPIFAASPNNAQAGCCVGLTGNVDCDPGDGCDISDLSTLIDNLFISFTPLCCVDEANTDGTGGIDISDLSALIDFLYISFTPTSACQQTISPGDLVITEIMPDPANIADASGEWLEITNVSGQTIDLAGCTVSDAGSNLFTIASSVVLPPGGIATLANSASPGFTPNYVYSNMSLLNTSDQIILKHYSVIIDAVAYTSGSEWPTMMSGHSYSLDPASYSVIDNDDGTKWCNENVSVYGSGDLGTPGVVNPSCPGGNPGGNHPGVGDLVITEIMPDPVSLADVDGEWFELLNVSSDTLDLLNCTVGTVGPDLFTITASVLVPPGGFVALARGPMPGFTPSYVYGGMSLVNSNGSLFIKYNSVVIDQTSYVASTAGQSLNLSPDCYDATCNDAGHWCPSGMAIPSPAPIYNGSDRGTPGAPNVTCP